MMGLAHLIIIILLFFAGVFFLSYAPYYGLKFDPDEWQRREKSFGDEERCGMYADLKYRILVPGMPKKEVFKLLGTPTSEFKDLGKRLYNHPNTSSYYIGMCGSWDINTIDILFDNNDRLLRVEHYQN